MKRVSTKLSGMYIHATVTGRDGPAKISLDLTIALDCLYESTKESYATAIRALG